MTDTTVRTLGTLIAPTSGSAVVAGLPLTPANGAKIRGRIAIVPESPGLYRRLSVRENLECLADLYGTANGRERITRALRAVNLEDRAEGLRRDGVTIFLTTHRLDEAERLCDRVAILTTTLRMTGRPAEPRDRLFARTLTVRVISPLDALDAVFTGVPGVEGWRFADGEYQLTVSDSTVAVRPGTPGAGHPLDDQFQGGPVPGLPR